MDVKKQGEVYTVFVTDPMSGATAAIQSFEAGGAAGFPQTFTGKASLLQWVQEKGKDPNQIRYVEKPMDPAQLEAKLRAELAARGPSPAAASPIKRRAVTTGERDVALGHYRRLLDRHAWCAPDLRDVTAIQLEAVEELMYELWDDIDEDLEKLKRRVVKPREAVSE